MMVANMTTSPIAPNVTPEVITAPWVIFGVGKTGISCARFLAARGLEFAAVDTRAEPPLLRDLRAGFPDVQVRCGALASDVLLHARHIVVSPGVPLDHPALLAAAQHGRGIIGDIELFARHAHAPVIAITGSNGKSTVTTLTANMLEAAGHDVRAGANLGTPALDLLTQPEPDFYVLELSSFQLETTTTLAPAVACILNISPDHLDRHHSFAAYVAAKARVLRGTRRAVLSVDDPIVAELATDRDDAVLISTVRALPNGYGLSERDGEPWLSCGGETLMPVAQLRIRGIHNAFNALAAIAITDQLGIPRQAQLAVLHEFTGLPHRCQLVAQRLGVSWFNDSKGTNIGATSAAVAGIFRTHRGVLIAGGQGKGADFRELRPALIDRVHTVVLLGEDARLIAAAVGDTVTVCFAKDMRDAVMIAAAAAQPGEAVLMSPACASFDMFENYEARGRAFVTAVLEELGT